VRFVPKVALAVVASNFLAAGEAPARVVPAGTTFQCTPTAVWDGDGPLWCAEGPKLRVAGVASREIYGTCRDGARLVRVLGGPKGKRPEGHVIVRSATMTCRSDGRAEGSRTAAWCVSPTIGDLSTAVVRAGAAVGWALFWRGHRC
jgi:hypothetical protein